MRRIDSLGVGATKLQVLPIAFATLTAAQVRTVARGPRPAASGTTSETSRSSTRAFPSSAPTRCAPARGSRGPYTGAGVNVAVIDTGVDGLHPDVPAGSKVEQYQVAGDAFEREPMTFTPLVTGDTYGHGTHVSSTIAGLGAASGGRYAGVAPGAKITSFKTDVGAVLLTSWALGAFDWILAHPEKGIRVSSNSWGSGDGTDFEPDNPVHVATKELYDAGISVVFAAGNSGGPNTLNQYAISPWVISAAASTKSLGLATFSSRGRIGGEWMRSRAQQTGTGIYRPTVTAPGDLINAAKSAQAVVMASGVDPENPMYTTASGTSMATPHIAGTIALMLEARSRLKPAHVIEILEGTADDDARVRDLRGRHRSPRRVGGRARGGEGEGELPAADQWQDAAVHAHLERPVQRHRAAEHVADRRVPGHDAWSAPPAQGVHDRLRRRRRLRRGRVG